MNITTAGVPTCVKVSDAAAIGHCFFVGPTHRLHTCLERPLVAISCIVMTSIDRMHVLLNGNYSKKLFFHRNDVVTTKTSIVQSNTGHRLILAIILMHDSVCFCCWLFCLHVKKLNVLICLKSFCSPWFYHRFHAT